MKLGVKWRLIAALILVQAQGPQLLAAGTGQKQYPGAGTSSTIAPYKGDSGDGSKELNLFERILGKMGIGPGAQPNSCNADAPLNRQILDAYNGNRKYSDRSKYPEMNQKMLDAALKGRERFMAEAGKKGSKIKNFNKFVMVDRTQCSNMPRLFVVTLQPHPSVEVMASASGTGTDKERNGWDDPKGFKNEKEHHTSELGFFAAVPHQTSNPKISGPTVLLEGLDGALNDQSGPAGKLIHASDYTHDVETTGVGATGDSYGCQTVPHKNVAKVVESSPPGFMDFAYFNLREQNRNKAMNNPRCRMAAQK